MELQELLYIIDLTGTFVFAMSGVITASERRMDIFGASVIGFVTAVGGGTIRDILIGSTPVGWMLNSDYLFVISAGILTALFLHKHISRWYKTMFIFDTVGIGLFTLLGMQKTLTFGLSPTVAVMMGTVSAVFGGVVRDVLVNRVPLIFRKEVYATACIAGAIFYAIVEPFYPGNIWTVMFSMAIIIAIRVTAVRRNWALPLPN
ncbi:MAG: trimeric intracellular cation channel family protein [Flavobacteriales bacterium]|nr:trimeric intracellular cation channel family protein [Flavobacteriales bacterium]MDG2247017.1 trimeric intracellular cation channel family protein [Flavobacteriales bacterium]